MRAIESVEREQEDHRWARLMVLMAEVFLGEGLNYDNARYLLMVVPEDWREQ